MYFNDFRFTFSSQKGIYFIYRNANHIIRRHNFVIIHSSFFYSMTIRILNREQTFKCNCDSVSNHRKVKWAIN